MVDTRDMRRIPLEDSGPGEPCISVQMPYAEFVRRFGEKHYDHPSGWDAPGPVELWAFELPWGMRLVLEYHPSQACFNVYLPVMEVDAVLDYLALREAPFHVNRELISWMVSQRPAYGEGLGKFSLYRQDDNGHTALMHTYESQRVADYYRKVFEDRGHRQLYWVKREEA